MNQVKSGFLFATPSFVSGAARLLDWYGLYDSYNGSPDQYEADFKALLSDWYVVGQDICVAMGQFEHSLPPAVALRCDDTDNAPTALTYR